MTTFFKKTRLLFVGFIFTIGVGTSFLSKNVLKAAATDYTLISSVSFESASGFVASTTYNNDTEIAFGTTGSDWMAYHGTASSTSPLTGSQSMQLRYYTTYLSGVDHRGHIGYTYNNYNLTDCAKMTFNATYTTSGSLLVQYSTDSGATWVGDTPYAITTAKPTNPYEYTAQGDSFTGNIRFKFTYVAAASPNGTPRLTIDDVSFFKVNATVYDSVTSVTLKNSSLTDYSGGTYAVGVSETITASVLPATANQNVTWSSSDITVAKVVGGVITAIGSGNATITATSVGLDSSSQYVIDTAAIIVNAFGISDLRSSGIPVASYSGKTVSVTGTVTRIEPLQGTVEIQSGNDAIQAYSCPSIPAGVAVGSLVKATGVVTNYNGLLELSGSPSIAIVDGTGETITPYEVLESNFNATNLLGFDSRLVTATIKYVSGTVASSAVSLSFTIGATSCVVRINYYGLANSIGSTVNAFLAKAGTNSTIVFNGVLGWNSGPQFALNSASELTSVAVTEADDLQAYLMGEDVTGQCSSKYSVAKTKFLALGSEGKYAFQNNSGYSAALARYQAWAVATGDATPFASGGLGVVSGIETNGNSPIYDVVIVVIIGITALGAYMMLSKKRHIIN